MRLIAVRLPVVGVALLLAVCAALVGAERANAATFTQPFAPDADAYVNSAKPSANYGTATTLRVGTSPERRAFLRFSLTGIADPVTKATLRVNVKRSSRFGLSVWRVSDPSWGEKALTWSSAPALASAATAAVGSVSAGWVALDVTPLVSGNGSFGFALSSSSTTSINLNSREAGPSLAPQLVVETQSVQSAPQNLSAPTIAGTVEQSQTLSVDAGSWSGTQPISYAYQWRRCDAVGAACADIDGASGQTYQLGLSDVGSTIRVQVTATNSAGSSSASSAATAPVSAAPVIFPPGSDPVVAAAGDIACNTAPTSAGSSCHYGLTAQAIAADPTITDVLTLGDNQYTCGEYSNFLTYYDPTWGSFKIRTHPSIGNHEYNTAPTTAGCQPTATTPGAKGYFDYWNGVDVAAGPAGDRSKGYYSYDIGSWHLIALNSNCAQVGGCAAGSAQETWLKSDLAAHPTECTLAYWHHPRWSSGMHGSNTSTSAFWNDLYAAGADLVLNGHDHDYERFAPQTPSGAFDPASGIREFVVGTGGRSHYAFTAALPNSELRNADTFGILKLSLHQQSYDWQFVAEPGASFSDAGSGACHG